MIFLTQCIPWFNVRNLDRITWTPGVGDWVRREEVSVEAGLAALSDIILDETGQVVHFERQVVRRPCIVLRGLVQRPPDDGRGFKPVMITRVRLNNDELARWRRDDRPSDSTHVFDFQRAAQHLDAPFMPGESEPWISNLFYMSADTRLDHTAPGFTEALRQILDNIQAQIGGEWSIEERDIEVWEPVVE